jgi:hypothetical protein
VKSVTEETWSKTYRYRVSNGIRVIEIELKKHIPSRMMLVGNRMLLSYEGQPLTCYGYNQPGHQYKVCPNRRQVTKSENPAGTQSWAKIVTGGNIQERLALHPPPQVRLDDMKDTHRESKTSEPVEDGKHLDRGEGGAEPRLWSSMLNESEPNEVGTLSDDVRRSYGMDNTLTRRDSWGRQHIAGGASRGTK